MTEEVKKIPEILKEIVRKLGAADKSVLEPYVAQLNELLENMKKSGQANIQANLTKALELTEKIKEAKVGEIPGLSVGINTIQTILKNRLGKTE